MFWVLIRSASLNMLYMGFTHDGFWPAMVYVNMLVFVQQWFILRFLTSNCAKQNRWMICISTSLFVCVEVLRPSQHNGVILSAVSLAYHTLTGRLSLLSG